MITNEQLLEKYLTFIGDLAKNTRYHRQQAILQYFSFLGDTNFLETTRINFAAFAKFKLEEKTDDGKSKCTRSSIKLYLLYVYFLYQFAYEEKLYPKDDLKLIKQKFSRFKVERGEQKKALDLEQVQLLLENCKNPTFKMATWTLLNFGLRLSELINLKLSDIDLTKKELLVRQSKAYRSRIILILPSQIEPIKQWLRFRKTFLPLDSQDDSFLILKKTEACPSGRWLQGLYLDISRILGFRVHAHRLRRTYASTMYFYHKMDIDVISYYLGHVNIQTTIIYLGISVKQKHERYLERMGDKAIYEAI